ncbi:MULTISPECIES: CdaR family transcriptional regulator [unclassified Nocardia]|uniref:PucR family transcriptional regulator n=1 Tax=unclassified Nocardia TaxID=2637762 RepID=UPI001CE3BDE3|nr:MULTISPECIES: helix-turn-helix domain-containing protein [unclassified Nocardia]
MRYAAWHGINGWAATAAVAFVVAGALQPGVAAAGPPVSAATDRQEQQLATRDGVAVSYVSFRLPLPDNAPPHPDSCDRAGFLRYRPVGGPADSRDADAVVVQQQGFTGGAMNSDAVAANTVRSAKASGRSVEFWALARRSQCLDETTGFDYALRTGNYLDAVDYYFNGKPVDGRTFPGFKNSGDLAILDWMGLERIIRDQYEIMLAEMPDQAERQRKYVCTGISMGGLVTGFFSDWDFGGGDPATAGYNQCAAFAAQDTMVSSDPAAIQNTPFFHDITDAIVGPVNGLVKAGLDSGVLPVRILGPTPVIGTKALLLYRLAGLAAYLEPDAESQLLAHIPRDPEIEATLAFMSGQSWGGVLTGSDGTLRDYRLTNTALLGSLIDNNSGNFALLQQGVGALSGGPVAEKTFPNPGGAAQIPVLGNFLRMSTGPQTRVAPTDHNVLYTWRNYNDVAGIPWTAPNHEIADIREVARQLGSGGPAAYWETYFPLRVVLDIAAGYGGARGGDMSNLRYHNMSRTKPNLVLYAGDSVVQYGMTWLPNPPLAQVESLPGYTHIDSIGAAAVQNNGKPDYSGQYLAEFIGAELPRATEANLRLFLRSVQEQRVPRQDELAELIAIAVRRARAGMALDTVLSVYHQGAVVAWNAIASAARTPEQREQLLAAVPFILGYLGAVTPGVAAAYVRERQDLHWEQREAKRAVAQALLQGNPVELLAERFGIALDGGFQVLVFRLAAEPDDEPGGVRPVLRIAQTEVDALSPRALSVLERGGGTVLLPTAESDAVAKLSGFVTRLSASAGVRTVAGLATAASVADIVTGAAEAAELALLARQLRRPTGIYRMSELALQYQLARPGPARAWLLGLLGPLLAHPHLLEALRALIAHDYNRQEAAASLVLHRNTLNYRLGRIATITGYDPGRPDHAQLFAAALTMRDLADAD